MTDARVRVAGPATRYRLARHVGPVPADRGDGLLAYDSNAEHYLAFNHTGRLIIELLDDGETVAATADTLAEVTDGEPEEILAATRAFVIDLTERGVLTERR